MKKSTLIMILSLVLAVALGVGGTLAYLTDTDADVNVMVMGDVQIVQNEQQRIEQGNAEEGLEEFKQYKELLPYVTIGNTTKENVTVGDYTIKMRDNVKNYVDKIVTVTNIGNNDAFVRTIIAVPTGEIDYTPATQSDNWLHWNYVSDTDTTPNNGWYYGENEGLDLNATDNENGVPTGIEEWEGRMDQVNGVKINGVEYDLFIFTNKNVIASGETTGPNMVGLYLDSRVDKDENGYFIRLTPNDDKHYIAIEDPSNVQILVASQAVQAGGFEEAGAWYALDAAFGDISAANHPWSKGMPEVGSPGEKNDTNNPPTLADYKVKSTAELLAAIEEAADAGEPAVIELAAGNYDNIDLNGIDNLTLRGAKGAEVKVSGIDLVRNENGKIGVNGLTLENIDFVDRGVTVDFTTGSPWNRIDGLTIRNCTYTGTDKANVEGNRLFDVCTDSVGSNQLFDLTIEGCEVTTAMQGIRMGGLDGTTTIKNNTITNVGHNAITLRSGRSDCLIEGNTITDGDDRAFRIGTISGGTVTYKNNTIVSTGDPDDGSNFKANTIGASASVVFEGNTVDGAAWSGI